jgi:hypothetical protein
MRVGETEREMVERHVADGVRHILRQREIIEELEDMGRPAGMARQLLRQFERLLEMHRVHLKRLSGSPDEG